MQKNIILAFLITLILGICVSSSRAKTDNAYDLIAAVNQLRAANGLPPYQIDGTLMAIAQAHSEYQTSINTVTHEGPGGTRPRDRAIAAGYGGGASIFISENIAAGTDLSPQTAVLWWQGDAPHLNTMLGANYQHVGAGVAYSGNYAYYTLDAAYFIGSSSYPTPTPGADPNITPAATAAIFVPILVSTPQPDGSVVHVVETGQTLIGIATVYDVSLDDLLTLNHLTMDSFIFPQDEILIQEANTPTVTNTPGATTTDQKPSTTPSLQAETSTPIAPPTLVRTPSPTTNTSTPITISPEREPVVVFAVLLALAALLVVIGSGLLKRS